ncbi:MAG: DHH family phosphoesterase [Candidatus Kerfeldbacteria bacterium]|nr:DHH family phosphoesterase [Candidatus Kerfeldbacteria bacterium]
MEPRDFEQADRLIQEARRIILVSHPKPDGDTIGSTLAMSHWLVNRHKDHSCFCVDPIPKRYRFLPGSDRFTTDRRAFEGADLVITFDGGDVRYLGIENEVLPVRDRIKILNIDHHSTNEFFGDVNIVDTHAASTADVVFRFLDYHRVVWSADMATCLLTGILTDTGNFSNQGTTIQAMNIASELLGYGARFRKIIEKTVANQTLPMLKLWGRAFERLRTDPETGGVSTAIFEKDVKETGATEEDASGVSNFLNSLAGVRYVLFLNEQAGGLVKGSLRTTHDDVDVAEIARAFGGGGHKKAAGFTVAGVIEEQPDKWTVNVVQS